jgi:hypothetical protein
MTAPRGSSNPQLEPCPLAQEVLNRFRALPPDLRRDPIAILMRIAVEVTREWMQHHPEGVDEFLRLTATPSIEVH